MANLHFGVRPYVTHLTVNNLEIKYFELIKLHKEKVMSRPLKPIWQIRGDSIHVYRSVGCGQAVSGPIAPL